MSRIRKPITAPYGRARIETHLDELASLRDLVEEQREVIELSETMIRELTEELRAEKQKTRDYIINLKGDLV